MFVPGNTLTGRAKGKKKSEAKLLLVEEWSYMHNDDFGLFYKQEAVFDQGNALNYRGIPWVRSGLLYSMANSKRGGTNETTQLYSHLTTVHEGKSTGINPLRTSYTSWTALKQVLKNAQTARSNSDWSSYLSAPFTILPPSEDEKTAQKLRSMLTGSSNQEWKIRPLSLSNITSIPLNPFVLEQADCTFGCEGHLCDAPDGCAPDLLCKNSICTRNTASQPGQTGAMCNSKNPCQPHLLCSSGKCSACTTRSTIPFPQSIKNRKRSLPNEPLPLPTPEDAASLTLKPNSPQGQCYTDSLPHLFASLPARISTSGTNPPPPICLPPAHHPAPCTQASHCSADEYCSWGTCTACTSSDACLGAPCRSNNKCKTGYCNDHGRCDYLEQRKKIYLGPGGAKMGKGKRVPGVPRGHESGPARVRDEAMRVVIPVEGAKKTGVPGVATA